MAKKTSASVSRFQSLLEDAGKSNLDSVYNKDEDIKTNSPATAPLIEADADATLDAEEVLEDMPVPEAQKKTTQKKATKNEKKEYPRSYRLTEKADRAVLILSNSGQFPVSGKFEMVDYIISKFIEKKNIREILEEGIKW